ncbi:hypothetical protein V1525DRAFT_392652 [Lipomyces kononenkoae]|uniref:Uncharacterized protein n=1 Tax=Lipomyces kononenkoae TaxID=34357 RepID=A0ACC3TBG3_LIPKO
MSEVVPSPQSSDPRTCWICLCTSNDPPPVGGTASEWRRPCKCNLTAHESCLLDWITSAKDELPCPQCGTLIRVSQSQSLSLRLRRALERLATRTANSAFILSIVAGAMSATYTALYVHGMVSVFCVCSLEDSLKILGWSKDSHSLEEVVYSKLFAYNSRKITLPRAVDGIFSGWWLHRPSPVAAIPIILVLSRRNSVPANAAVNTALAITLRQKVSPGLNIADTIIYAFPVLRILHGALYRRYIVPQRLKWEREAQSPSTSLVEPEPIAEELPLEDGVGPQQIQVDGEVQPNLVVELNGNLRRGNLGVIVNNQNITTNFIGALVYPALSGLMGDLLAKIFPKLSKRIQDRLVRSLIGGCLVVLLKDVFDTYCSYLLSRQAKTRRILDYPGSRPL